MFNASKNVDKYSRIVKYKNEIRSITSEWKILIHFYAFNFNLIKKFFIKI